MPNETRINLIKKDQNGDAYGYRITTIYWVLLPNGDTKFIEVYEGRHDPNGNGKGNFSESIRVRIISPEEMEKEASPEVAEMIFQLIDKNLATGTLEIKVSQNTANPMPIAEQIRKASVIQEEEERIEIVTQDTVSRLARRHPSGVGFSFHDDGDHDCDCNDGD